MRRTIIDHREQSMALGVLQGSQQAEEHQRSTGAPRLSEASLLGMADMAWKYEGLPRLGDPSARAAFVRGYLMGYRAPH